MEIIVTAGETGNSPPVDNLTNWHSEIEPSTQRSELTLFRNKYSTAPMVECSDLAFSEFIEHVAPSNGPMITKDKGQVHYLIPGLLKEGELINRTRQRAISRGESTIGKQRSGWHVTTASILMLDFDGISEKQFDSLNVKLAGCAHLIYSTYSHANPEKPGNRIRLVVPLDRAVGRDAYKMCHIAADELLGVPADKTGQRLEQQQGVWATHPAWKHAAFRHVADGAVLSVEKLLATAKAAGCSPIQRMGSEVSVGLNCDLIAAALPGADRILQAVPMMYAADYTTWTKVIMACKASAPYYPVGFMQTVAIAFHQTSPARSTRALRSEQSQYDPVRFFESVDPQMPEDVAVGVILANARDHACALLDADIKQGHLSRSGADAAKYLQQFHPAAYAELMEVAHVV